MPFDPTDLTPYLAKRVRIEGECWQWTGYTKPDGYGVACIDYTSCAAHRAVWTTLVGPVTPDLHLHHTCGNRNCVNPDHLEPITASRHSRLHVELEPRKIEARHGTRHMYRYHRCRCEECKAANLAHRQEVSARLKARPTPDQYHGTSTGYDLYGCRCAPCKQWRSDLYARTKAATER